MSDPIDYGIFYRRELPLTGEWGQLGSWDFFVSAYNISERVNMAFAKASATTKIWAVHEEYQLDTTAIIPEKTYRSQKLGEDHFVFGLWDKMKDLGFDPSKSRLCIDITGFLRPHLLFLLRFLYAQDVKSFDAIYSEPGHYAKKEKTAFSGEVITGVRQVLGYEGLSAETSNDDLLIIGAGYDHNLIAEVAEAKDKADKIQIFGLPSLRADMYQQSVLRASQASNATGHFKLTEANRSFAPANDPFATATILSEIVCRREKLRPITNLYLSPLGTKAQALGFGLYYIGERLSTSTSIIFPFSPTYAPETSAGVSRFWKYTIEFPLV